MNLIECSWVVINWFLDLTRFKNVEKWKSWITIEDTCSSIYQWPLLMNSYSDKKISITQNSWQLFLFCQLTNSRVFRNSTVQFYFCNACRKTWHYNIRNKLSNISNFMNCGHICGLYYVSRKLSHTWIDSTSLTQTCHCIFMLQLPDSGIWNTLYDIKTTTGVYKQMTPLVRKAEDLNIF